VVAKTQENIVILSGEEKQQQIDKWEQIHWTGWWIKNAETKLECEKEGSFRWE
jgi:hypothetical protein